MKKNADRSFVLLFTALTLVIPVLIIALNFFQDPHHRYRSKVPTERLEELAKSPDKILTVPGTYDDRILLKRFMEVSPAPRILVLGGSIAMDFQQEMFTERLLNAGVTAGSIQDFVAIWALAEKNHFHPRMTIMVLAEYNLHPQSFNERYLSIYEDYLRFSQKGISLRAMFSEKTSQFKDLLSLQTTQSSLMGLFTHSKEQTQDLVSRSGFDFALPARTLSFSMLYPKDYEERTPKVTNPLGVAHGLGEAQVFEKWNVQGGGLRFELLRQLIRRIQDQGSRVLILTMPYHPQAYAVIRENPKAYANFKNYLQAIRLIAAESGVDFYNQADSTSFWKEDEFTDGVHLKTAVIYRWIKAADQEFQLGIANDAFGKEPIYPKSAKR
ncbi:MAG: SGNH/GDSL hydrolase family protein [Candidatus Omnitrophica bacterium]|nr:SGNH/GDSL hydrolase family protein [Candidatus Omnitrophota bacterium]